MGYLELAKKVVTKKGIVMTANPVVPKRPEQEPYKLYPYLGQVIDTPLGKGKLLQVFESRVTVVLKDATRATFFCPQELLDFMVSQN